MDGSRELRHLAHLLREGADTAREIAAIRQHDSREIDLLADQAHVMADKLDEIASRPVDGRLDGSSDVL